MKNRFVHVGVAQDHDHYRWWALSCTSLGMLLAATNSGTLIIALPDLERALKTSILSLVWVILAYMIASTVLVLTAGRLSDLFGRKTAYVGGFAVFALGLAGRGLRRRRDAADPLADRAGRRRGVPVRQRGRARDRRVPARGARPGDGDEHDGRRDRARARPGARRRARGDRLAVGLLVQRAARARRRRSGAALVLHELARPDSVRGFDIPGVLAFVVGLTGLVLGVSRGGISQWNDPIVIVCADRRGRPAAAVRRSSSAARARRCST